MNRVYRTLNKCHFSTSTKKYIDHSSSAINRQKLVILGTGWSSYSVLKNINKKLYDVVVVSPRNHFLFTPLLASTTVGTLEFRSIIEPVRNTGFRNSDDFHLSEVTDVNFNKKTVKCQSVLDPTSVYELKYDKLVIGVGSVSNTFGIPGVKEHAFFLKEISDARSIRNRILQNFELSLQPGISIDEKKRLLHFLIVGGGPTGIEFGAEIYDFVTEDVSRLYKQEKEFVKVSLVEGKSILPSFDEKLRKYAEKKINQRKGMMSLVHNTVSEVTATDVTLQDGTKLPCGLVVWSAGLAPRPFVESLDVPKNPQGQILTNRFLHLIDDPSESVFAIGDCADIAGYGLPSTAQVAEREGKYMAAYLNSKEISEVKPFSFANMGMLAYIGKYEAVTDTPALKSQGFHSWVLWRSAYLTRLGSWRLRMQVPIDWLKTIIFGRDISRF